MCSRTRVQVTRHDGGRAGRDIVRLARDRRSDVVRVRGGGVDYVHCREHPDPGDALFVDRTDRLSAGCEDATVLYTERPRYPNPDSGMGGGSASGMASEELGGGSRGAGPRRPRRDHRRPPAVRGRPASPGPTRPGAVSQAARGERAIPRPGIARSAARPTCSACRGCRPGRAGRGRRSPGACAFTLPSEPVQVSVQLSFVPVSTRGVGDWNVTLPLNQSSGGLCTWS